MPLLSEKIIQIFDNKPLVKIYSHPRSGTHLAEAFLAENFYKYHNLSTKNVVWGHWSNRKINNGGNPYGKLFGLHKFPEDISSKKLDYGIYIVRDPRAVALSIWKTPNFLHKKYSSLSFSKFLSTPLDWKGSPANETKDGQTIFEHWLGHTNAWTKFVKNNKKFMIIRYEDILENPDLVADSISSHFDFLKNPKKVKEMSKPVGLLPNKAVADEWKKYFSSSDLELFAKTIPKNNPYVIQDEKLHKENVYEKSDNIFLEDNDAKLTVVVFGGIRMGVGIPPFEFFNILKDVKVNKIFVRDPYSCWYHKGIGNQPSSIKSVATDLKKVIPTENKVVMIGNSAGGYAAILFGYLLKADSVMTFSPQVFIDKSNREKAGDKRWKKEMKDLYEYIDEDAQYLDLAKINKSFLKKVKIYYSSKDELDTYHAKKLVHLGAKEYKYNYGDHNLVKELRDNGDLKKILKFTK